MLLKRRTFRSFRRVAPCRAVSLLRSSPPARAPTRSTHSPESFPPSSICASSHSPLHPRILRAVSATCGSHDRDSNFFHDRAFESNHAKCRCYSTAVRTALPRVAHREGWLPSSKRRSTRRGERLLPSIPSGQTNEGPSFP